jgi:hypothetical protein
MSTFNINHIIKQYNLDEDSLSKELFPNNKFPKIALTRITSGVSYLDTSQLDILAKIIDVEPGDLLRSQSWTSTDINIFDTETITFKKNNFRVELSLNTLITKIYSSDKLIASETLISDKNIKLSEYLELVNRTIINLI